MSKTIWVCCILVYVKRKWGETLIYRFFSFAIQQTYTVINEHILVAVKTQKNLLQYNLLLPSDTDMDTNTQIASKWNMKYIIKLMDLQFIFWNLPFDM